MEEAKNLTCAQQEVHDVGWSISIDSVRLQAVS